MVDNKSKTKTEMLLELESIKGLLREEDDIPILQEMIAAERNTETERNTEAERSIETIADVQKLKPQALATSSQPTPGVEQQDFFNKSATVDSATQLLNTLSDLAALTDAVATHKTTAGHNTATKAKPAASHPDSIKAAGENPFLPAHIRTRLHGNNPPPLFELETAKKIVNSSRPTTFLGNTQYTAKATNHQQELIDDILETMLPEIEKELRERLMGMTKEMLMILIAEKK